MSIEKQRRIEGVIFLVAFGLTIPVANWLIGNAGTVCVPNGPCLIPVAPGVMAPSGVLMIGVALVLRDLVQRRLGTGFSAAAVLAGALISMALAPPALVIASGVAFLLSEFADLAVYTPLARRGLVGAVVASSLVVAGGRFHRVPVARLRLIGLPAGPGHRQGVDGAALDSVRDLAATARRAARPRASLIISGVFK